MFPLFLHHHWITQHLKDEISDIKWINPDELKNEFFNYKMGFR